MKSSLSHILFGVRPENMGFYRDLFGFLGWQTLYDSDAGGVGMLGVTGGRGEVRGLCEVAAHFGVGMLGVTGGRGESGESLWFTDQVKDTTNDYDAPGVNHVSIGTETQADVDTAADYLRGRGVEMLFETPRHRPEFAMSEGETYYQIMFESPDRILWEVVYIGPKAA